MASTNTGQTGPQSDPRPLRSEPLPLDLLNTNWIEDGRLCDLLDTVAGTELWLASAVLEPRWKVDGADESSRLALRSARDAIRAVATDSTDPAAREAFNALLAQGYRRHRLTQDGPHTDVVVDGPDRLVPWLAAEVYVDLLTRMPERIRQCQHPQCVLWYLDTSPARTRRWCSMSVCGNRAKASRHYARKPRQ